MLKKYMIEIKKAESLQCFDLLLHEMDLTLNSRRRPCYNIINRALCSSANAQNEFLLHIMDCFPEHMLIPLFFLLLSAFIGACKQDITITIVFYSNAA